MRSIQAEAPAPLGGSPRPRDTVVTLVFDRPQTIRQIGIEVEETEESRTQELSVSALSDGG